MDKLRRKEHGETEPEVLPIKPDDLIWTFDDYGQAVQVHASVVVPDEQLSLTWEEAWTIHAARKKAKTGRPLAESTKRSARNSWKDLGIEHPARVTTADVRDYVNRLQAKGYAVTSVMQRHGVLVATYAPLIDRSYSPKAAGNPWTDVEVSARKENHHRAATKEETET